MADEHVLPPSQLPKYNISGYNTHTKPGRIVQFVAHASSSFAARVGGALTRAFFAHANSRVEGHALMHSALPFKGTAHSQFGARALMHLHIIFGARVDARIVGEFHLGKVWHTRHEGLTDVRTWVHMGKIMHASPVVLDNHMGVRASMGKVWHVELTGYSGVGAEVLMGFAVYTRFTVNTTIPAGGEIRINSDTFTVSRGFENIFHTHRGGWLFFDQDTAQIVIEAQTGGNLTGEVVYEARFI